MYINEAREKQKGLDAIAHDLEHDESNSKKKTSERRNGLKDPKDDG